MGTQVRKRLSSKKRRQQLLVAAIDLFAERGLGEAKHADIARRVKTSIPTTFVYFPTREDLLADVGDEIGLFFLGVFDGVIAEKGHAPDVLKQLAARMMMAMDSHPSYIRVWLGWSTRFDTVTRAQYLKYQEKYLSRLSELLWASEDNVSQENRDDARILLSATQALALMKIDGEPNEKIERFTEHTIEVLNAYWRAQGRKI